MAVTHNMKCISTDRPPEPSTKLTLRVRWRRLRNPFFGVLFGTVLVVGEGVAQTVLTECDPAETVGERPYEMIWAGRKEPAVPLVRFGSGPAWSMKVENGAKAEWRPSRAQNIWDRPVARLRYQGDGNRNGKPNVILQAPAPIPIPADADCVELWVFGNRWDWENPPDTPPVELSAHLREGNGQLRVVPLGNVRWKEWWLVHQRLPVGLKAPVAIEALAIGGGWQSEPRELYFDSANFFREELKSLKFAPRPERNLTLAPGQSAGANTGPGRLPFPTREETILPALRGGAYRTEIAGNTRDGFELVHHGEDGNLTYRFKPEEGFDGLRVTLNQELVGQPLAGARLVASDPAGPPRLKSAERKDGIVMAEYEDGTEIRVRLWHKSLVVDVINRSGQVTAFELGHVGTTQNARAIGIPYLTFGGTEPKVLVSQAGAQRAFTSVWLDWYRSNGSEPYGVGARETNHARINGGMRYLARSDGKRNPVYERLFITVSPRFEEVLPVIPNPVGAHAAQAVDRLWQESWGPDNYETQMERSRGLRAHGIEKLIQCNHEITWRDGGESFTLRRKAAPKRGGDAALKRYVDHQKSLGWLVGLYGNYTDFAPVNEYWDPDWVQRRTDHNWIAAWPRCYALKALRAVEMDAILAPEIKRKFDPTSAYTDVHTAVPPWAYNDYDARDPGAGTFAQTCYAYGEILRNDSRVFGGPIFSEGTYQWIYAGLADGNYALVYNNRPMAEEPLLPVFDLLEIHPKECDIGMGWTTHFCASIPNWRAPENLDHSIDRFLLNTLAYGHIGWLVEEEYGWSRVARSYYMIQPVQARYGLKAPTEIQYWDGQGLVDVSTAVEQDLPRTRRQMRIDYPGGLTLWLNDQATNSWRVNDGARAWVLPPAGWAVATASGEMSSYSALVGTNHVDYMRCPEFVYLDGRGQWFETPEGGSNGSLAIFPRVGNGVGIIRFSGEGEMAVKRPFQTRGALRECLAWDAKDKPLAAPAFKDDGQVTRVTPVPEAIRYELRFQTGAEKP